ncbi:WXG100 family type VII secretion target [Actinoplanes sp. NEAU-A12]|uniref:ESAT-6-like protein n=1 Tax=Actinoplanes sandaracinus TaxID=3045177 RepID=A0ABT6WLL1_9ACTN|nr:WXG100 family type VII secretion target [Actinoplanes sandaracinus]MDI6100609.1 WXG100 family type VII secretion target [Actinoplanes sandaracinus]
MALTQSESNKMAQTAKDFDEVNSSLQDMLTRLMGQLSVLSGAWKGQGALAFEHVKNEYANDLKRLNDALAETAEAIRTSGASYESTDSAAASYVRQTGGQFTLPL